MEKYRRKFSGLKLIAGTGHQSNDGIDFSFDIISCHIEVIVMVIVLKKKINPNYWSVKKAANNGLFLIPCLCVWSD